MGRGEWCEGEIRGLRYKSLVRVDTSPEFWMRIDARTYVRFSRTRGPVSSDIEHRLDYIISFHCGLHFLVSTTGGLPTVRYTRVQVSSHGDRGVILTWPLKSGRRTTSRKG